MTHNYCFINLSVVVGCHRHIVAFVIFIKSWETWHNVKQICTTQKRLLYIFVWLLMKAKALVPVMLDLMEALVASLQHMGRLDDRPSKFVVTGSAGIYWISVVWTVSVSSIVLVDRIAHNLMQICCENNCRKWVSEKLFMRNCSFTYIHTCLLYTSPSPRD